MPQVVVLERERRKSHGKRALVAGVGVVVLAIAAVAFFFAAAAADFAAVTSHAKQLDQARDYAAEVSVLSAYYSRSPLSHYRYQVALQLGDVTLRQHDYDAAFKWYFAAAGLTHDPPLHLLVGLAKSAQGSGDKATAITYYQKVIALQSKDTSKQAQQDVEGYQDQVRYLERSR